MRSRHQLKDGSLVQNYLEANRETIYAYTPSKVGSTKVDRSAWDTQDFPEASMPLYIELKLQATKTTCV